MMLLRQDFLHMHTKDELPKATGKHYIDGHWIAGSGKHFESINPCHAHCVWQGHIGTSAEAGAAFEAAKRAQINWGHLSWETRASYLETFANTVLKKKAILVHLISLETGKPLWEAETEADAVIQKIKLTIEAYQTRICSQFSQTETTRHHLGYKPHGVVVVLGAFNFPAHLSNGHIIPSLLSGNTVIYKPSEYTPLVAEFITQCFHESELPQGVLNLIQGDPTTAKALIALPIQVVCFTGSYATGVKIHQQLSARPEVLLALEMGGNNPLVIDEKLDNIDAAVYLTLLSAYLTTGQRCTSARRLIIPNNKTGSTFLNALQKAMHHLVIGPPENIPTPFMGPIIRPTQAMKHLNAAANLIYLGAEPITPMQIITENSGFLSPGLLDMKKVHQPPDEEIFAPLLTLYRYDDFDEALALANQTKYGLVAGLFSDSEARFHKFYQTVRAGLINWNTATIGASSRLPFGGIGRSGNHRPSGYFAVDYAAYPIASLETDKLSIPNRLLPGVQLGSS